MNSSNKTIITNNKDDKVLEHICNYTLATLRLKADKWEQMMANPRFRLIGLILLNWLQNGQHRVLVVTLNLNGSLMPTNSINEISQQYVIPSNTQKPTSIASNISTELSTSLLAVSAAMNATACLLPMPATSSSFSTLDGVPRGKCTYFLRKQLNIPLTNENFRNHVIFGDFPIHSKMETLSVIFEEVLKPLLQCAGNRKLRSDVQNKDLDARVKDIHTTLIERGQVKGKINNKTILSLLLPSGVIENMLMQVKQGSFKELTLHQFVNKNIDEITEPKIRLLMEEMIINWLAKMDSVIKEKSEYNVDSRRLKNDIINVCLPVHEINFWINRQENLQNIYNQLTASTHKAVTEILEAINSTYCPSFKKIFHQLIYALSESQDISIWLKPLLQQTIQFSSVHFNSAHHLIVPLVHVIHLIWSGARYYKSTSRMTTLLRCICNFLVCRAQEDLEVANLFNLDADEGLQKISKTLEILELFK
uniref:Dynein heavy chain tail domain-containing protein n=1 Tax=Glossina brevipalpis TaxID=37001 RepID=A0A1A9W2M5_9MUSC